MANANMKKLRYILTISLTLKLLLSASLANAVDSKAFIKFDSIDLTKGRTIWLDSCKGCHAYGTAGAPIPMNPDEWSSRVTKSKSTLYDHAINGFFGEDDTMMPERGGNPDLSDQQVKLAVDYMVSLATFYINQKN